MIINLLHFFVNISTDVLDDVDGNMITDMVYYDTRLGGDPAIMRLPDPGTLVARHSSFVDALRKKASAQET